MKMKFSSVVIALIIVGAFSCNKYDFNYPPDTVGISKIIYFPSIAIYGDKLQIINMGGTYTDSVTATLGGAPATYTTDGSVDVNTPGIYILTYTAANPQGYTASDWRTVVVMGNDISANDFSGTYTRVETGVTSTWTKTAPGVYTVENAGGAGSGVGLTSILVNYTGQEIAIPQQVAPDYGGTVSTSNAVFTAANAYQWVFNAPGYGTSTRHFSK